MESWLLIAALLLAGASLAFLTIGLLALRSRRVLGAVSGALLALLLLSRGGAPGPPRRGPPGIPRAHLRGRRGDGDDRPGGRAALLGHVPLPGRPRGAVHARRRRALRGRAHPPMEGGR